MFDIGFSELVIIGVVALIVIGPEKLPKTARTLGHLFGRLQRYVSDVKADISREMELEELRKLQTQVQSAARDIETSVSAAARDVETGVRNVESELNATGAGGFHPAADRLRAAVAGRAGRHRAAAQDRRPRRAAAASVAAGLRSRLNAPSRFLHDRNAAATGKQRAGNLHLASHRAA